MKKFLFSAVAVLFCLGLSAQDVKKIRNAYDKKDWPKAKEAVDLALANEKEQKNWEAWYYKGLIYGQIAKDANLKATVPDAWMQSFDAYQKAMELDQKQAEIFMMTRQYPVFENYLELQKEANAFYNSGNYQGALDGYKKADKVGRFIFKNKWALSEVDTILYYYAGAAAMQLENKEEVVSFFQKLADANIGGEGYDVVYRYLAYYYEQKKDAEAAKKYADAGRKLYPKDTYYDRIELDKMRKNGADALEIFKKYEGIIETDPKDYEVRYDYAAEIFNWLYMDSKATAEQKPAHFDKIISALKKCIEVDPKQPDAHLLIGKTYFNEAAFMQDEMKKIKGTTPADTQKKTEMKKQMEERMKEALPHLDNSLNIYTAMTADQLKDKRTKNEYKSTLYLLTEAHRFLGNKDKEKEFDAKYQALNQ
jgi:tetratricopeptide (TPR) repeat protein